MFENDMLPILIYYNIRGQLQPIRNLFCFMNVPFFQIHLQNIQGQKNNIPAKVLEHVAKFKIEASHLPIMIYGDLIIQGALSIAMYSSRKFNHKELLGTNLQTRSRLHEILEIYFLKQPQSMIALFKCADYSVTARSAANIDYCCKNLYEELMQNSKYIKQICQYVDNQQNLTYVFGEITLIDFFFLQTCFYMLGVANSPDRIHMHKMEKQQTQKQQILQKTNAYYLTIMIKYRQFMEKTEFYSNYKKYLQQFSIVNEFVNKQKAAGLKLMWSGDKKFVS